MASQVDNILTLDELGNIPAAYAHEWRTATPQEPISVPGGVFKWYHVHRDGASVPTEMDANAQAVIMSAVEHEGWDLAYGLNFALLHLSTAHAFLITGVWRNHQELWERIYVLDLAHGDEFVRAEPGKDDAPAACVWELGVICHERMAWHRYLFTERTSTDKRAWLSDTYSGQV